MSFENLKSTGIKYVLTKLKEYFVQIKDAVKTVNGEEADSNGNITLNTVPYAQNLESESSQRKYGTFLQRMSGGDGSINDGDAWLMVVRGNNEHTGYTPESIEMTVTSTATPEISAELDRDTFVAYQQTSGTVTLTYTTAWSEDPTLYGITVTGTPASGDTIVVVYTAEERGTITVAAPTSFVATGWNLYSYARGYAKVVKYEHGYKIEGTYTTIKFSTTPEGTGSDIAVNDGYFDIPSDGYILVTDGNSTDTAIYPVWEDWTDEHAGDWEGYTETTVDLTGAIGSGKAFPYGLMKAGTSADEIDLNLGQTISRVERLAYTDENIAAAKASGREYEYDENYIYLARATAVVNTLAISGAYTASDHGIEYFNGSTVPVQAETLYGTNLKNKLERDVLTISQQTLTAPQKTQARTNIDAASATDLSTLTGNIPGLRTAIAGGTSTASITVSSNMVSIIVGMSGNPATHSGLWLVRGASTLDVIQIYAGSAISYSVSGRTITFTHSSGRSTQYALLEIHNITG